MDIATIYADKWGILCLLQSAVETNINVIIILCPWQQCTDVQRDNLLCYIKMTIELFNQGPFY